MRLARILPLLFGWLMVSVFLTATTIEAKMRTEPLTLVTASGRHDFSVEIAATDADQAMGLMFRRSLGRRAGMLFHHAAPTELTMWMKNTYISLDMVFIKADGTVHRIAKGTEPFSESIIASEGKVSAVLEIAAGVADEIGLKAGDKVEHRSFVAK